MQKSRSSVPVRFAFALTLTACGGGPPRTAPQPVSGAPAGLPDLTAQLQAAVRGPQPGDAVITYAIFAPGKPEKRLDLKLAAAVETAFRAPPPEWAEAARRAGPMATQLTLSSAPVDTELPLNLEVLVEAAGPLGPQITQAGQVAFVRFAGRPQTDHTQITGAGLAAVAVARLLGAPVVVDLSTFDAAAPDALAASLAAVPDLRTHVRIAATEDPAGTVTLRSRGLARFGKPDLELSGLPAAEVQIAGPRFMQAMQAVWEAPKAAPGDRVGGFALTPCGSPPESWDHECVSLAP